VKRTRSLLFVGCAALLVAASTARADIVLPPAPLSFTLSPALTIPLGPGSELFLPGGGVGLAVEYALPSVPMLSLGGGAFYTFTPIAGGLGTTSQLAGVAGAAWRFPIAGRLSARVFARAGYGLGLVHGDPLANVGGGPLAEGGAGVAFAVSPAAVARLDVSYTYLLAANGTLAVSLGVSMRPRIGGPATAAGTRRPSLEIAEVDLQSLYPALRRSSDNRPTGTAIVRNAGRRPITDLHVALRAPGVMDRRESAARRELAPGDTWEAPLVVLVGPGGARGPTTAEVVVTWVEQGEPWEARKDVSLRVFDPHLVPADDLRAAAAFVLPFDPAVRDLAAAVSAAVAAQSADGIDPAISTAIAAREAVRLLGIRATADRTTTDGGDSAPLRRLKYPAETLHDLSTWRSSAPPSWKRRV